MSIVEKFNQFKEQNPNWMKDFHVVPTTSKYVNYGRVKITAKQVMTQEMYDRISIKRTPKVAVGDTIKIKYACAIDLSTGNVYLDCDKKKIMYKNALLIVGRIGYTLIGKTAYHAAKAVYHATFIFPIVSEIFAVMAKPDKERTFGAYASAVFYRGIFLNIGNIFQNVLDVPLTPCYWVALTTLHVAGVVLGLFNSDLIYKQREWAYAVDLASNHGDRKAYFMKQVSPCFGPLYGNIADKAKKDEKDLAGYMKDFHNVELPNYYEQLKKFKGGELETEPEKPEPPTLAVEGNSLQNFARNQMEVRQTTNLPGNGCAYLPADENYTSPAWPKTVEKKKPTEGGNSSPVSIPRKAVPAAGATAARPAAAKSNTTAKTNPIAAK